MLLKVFRVLLGTDCSNIYLVVVASTSSTHRVGNVVAAMVVAGVEVENTVVMVRVTVAAVKVI